MSSKTPAKYRLDQLVHAMGLAPSRQRARSLIMAGKVLVNDRPVDKPGATVSADDTIRLKGDDLPYVSRGGLKLEAALEGFGLEVNGWICLDVGASTGGFTDCLLQHGARRVYAVDVGYGQLAWQLRQDERVVVIERTNARHLTYATIGEAVDLATVDVSFISLRLVVPVLLPILKRDARMIVLVKPQFEVGKGKVGKGGVVRDPDLHREVLQDLALFFRQHRLTPLNTLSSPILGPKGNREFLMLIRNGLERVDNQK
jgi:23S rRNA (cytidine1920-2'-O)/16S rRNA (cytidine1409-2'-O)-methyltransferase